MNLITRAKVTSSSKTIFYKEIKNIKQTLINNGLPNYIVDHIYPTPPLGQDMTQGHFLSGV